MGQSLLATRQEGHPLLLTGEGLWASFLPAQRPLSVEVTGRSGLRLQKALTSAASESGEASSLPLLRPAWFLSSLISSSGPPMSSESEGKTEVPVD